MRKTCFAAVVVGLLLPVAQVFAQEGLQTNAEMLHKVLDKSVLDLAEHLRVDMPIAVQVRYPGYDWFIRHRIVETLTGSGYRVAGNGADAGAGQLTLDVGVERLGVRYSDLRRPSMFRSRVMTRRAEAVLSIQLSGEEKVIVVRSSESIIDTVPYSSRAEIENAALPFTVADPPSGSAVERYLGPAVILAATGIVIYLFFSVRS
jgi:hypothetical protein